MSQTSQVLFVAINPPNWIINKQNSLLILLELKMNCLIKLWCVLFLIKSINMSLDSVFLQINASVEVFL